jgi:Chaperone of endosialidase
MTKHYLLTTKTTNMLKIQHIFAKVTPVRKPGYVLTLLLALATAGHAQQWNGNNNITDSIYRTGKVVIGRNLTTSPITLNAQLQVERGPIAQVQGGLYGRFAGDGIVTKPSKWIGLGEAGTIFSPIPTTYGLAINSSPKFAFYNLVDTTRIAATKDLIAGFGTNTTNIDTNQRFIFRYFTGVPTPNGEVPVINRDIMALRPNGSVGVNEVNPPSTFFVNAIPSSSRFKAITILNEQDLSIDPVIPAQTFTAIGAQGNSNVPINVFGLRSQIGVGTGRVAVDLQVNRAPQAPVATGQQEAELVFQDLNFAGPVTATNPGIGNATAFDRFSIFFRSGSTNFADRSRVMTILANGTMGINTRNVNPVTVATGLIAIGTTPAPTATTPINLDIPNGSVRAIGYYRLSDAKLKTNITTIGDATTKLTALRGVRYEFKGFGNEVAFPTYGFIAQEAQKVMPELAVTTNDGVMAVDYDGFVPLLVQGFKEQQGVIEEQRKQLEATQAQLQKLYDLLGINQEMATPATVKQDVVDNNPEFPNTRLLQNRPNPSNGSTVIEYSLNDNGTALLTITDMAGITRKVFSGLAKGNNRLIINAGELAPGIYNYTLTIDGKIAGSRKMVIVK